MSMRDVIKKVITKNRESVAHTSKNLLSVDLLLQMGAQTLPPDELEALRAQKEGLQAALLGIEEDDKDDREVLARRARFQADQKVRLLLFTGWPAAVHCCCTLLLYIATDVYCCCMLLLLLCRC
jgi:hypothetical protein